MGLIRNPKSESEPMTYPTRIRHTIYCPWFLRWSHWEVVLETEGPGDLVFRQTLASGSWLWRKPEAGATPGVTHHTDFVEYVYDVESINDGRSAKVNELRHEAGLA